MTLAGEGVVLSIILVLLITFTILIALEERTAYKLHHSKFDNKK